MLGPHASRYALIASTGLMALASAAPDVLDPTITPAPVAPVPFELMKRQVGSVQYTGLSTFVGWQLFSGSYITISCAAPATYVTAESSWYCCNPSATASTAGCGGPIGCTSGTLFYAGSTGGTNSYPCLSVYTAPTDQTKTACATTYIFESTGAMNPVTQNYCADQAYTASLYRLRPSDPVPSTRVSTISVSSASTARSLSPSLASLEPAVTLAPSPSVSVTPESSGSSSKAWIAGAVVGPIAGLALIGALAWFFLARRRKSTSAQGPLPQQGYNPGADGAGMTQGYYQPTEQKPQMAPYGVAGGHQGWQSETYAQHGHIPQAPVEAPGEAVAYQQRSPVEIPTHSKSVRGPHEAPT